MKLHRLLLCVGVVIVAAAPVHAGGYLMPAIGVATGGDTDDSKITYVGSLLFTGEQGRIGFRIDFGTTPDFLGSNDLFDNNVTTFMGDLVLITPGPMRFYGSAGAGPLKARVDFAGNLFDIDSNELGMNVGGGVMVLPGDGRFGFHGDVRYFRQLTDPEPDDEFDVDLGNLDFWRVTGGLVIKF